jgi:iron complex outermembrane receptor protein
MTNIKSAWLYCGLLTAALIATTVQAQPLEPAATQAADTDRGTEIVVTARKRSEAIQDVPLSISAVTGADLERRNIQDVSGLYAQTPGLFTAPGSVNNTNDLAYLTMRGIGFNAGLEPAVGVFIDGMYQPQIGFDTAFLDLQRIEVLRGPQGTLFGRNTQGGAINMITRKPGPETHGKLSVDAASFNTLRAQGAIDGQIADNLYGGLSAGYAHSDGYIDNDTLHQHQNSYDQQAVRGTLRWAPTDALDFTLIADASRNKYNELVRGVRLAGDHQHSLIDQDAPEHKTNHGIQLNAVYKINDSLTLTSITGYRYSDSDSLADMDSHATTQEVATLPAYAPLTTAPVTVQGATLAAQVSQSFQSQEFRLEGEAEKLNWLAGVYYFSQDQHQTRQREVGPHVAYTLPAALYIYEDYRDAREGYAIFGQASYRPVEKLELTLGVRSSHEKVDGTGQKVSVFGAPVNRTAPLPRDGHPEFDNVSWMGSASWKFTPDVLVYATYAQGWKAGGVERYPGRADHLTYKDENSGNFEVGVKSSLLDQRVTLNAAAYHIDIKNQQMNNVIPDPHGGPVPITVIDSASRSHVDGVEGELGFRATKALHFSAAVSYSNGVFDDFVRAFSATDTFDMSGKAFENVPKLTASASVNYRRPLADGKTIEAFAEYRYIDEITFQDNTRRSTAHDQLTTPAYDRVNLSLSLVTKGGLRFTGYVNNAFNSFDYSYISSDPLIGGDVFVVPLAPREYGLRISKSF